MVNFADPYRAKPYVLDGQTAPACWLVGTLWLPMATGVQTGNRLTVLEQHMPSGLGPPAHFHPVEEGFYILEGECTFIAAGQSRTIGPRSFVHLPRLTPHTFVVESSKARVINFYTPAGFEMILMSVATLAPERRQPSKEEAPMPPPEQVRILSKLFGMEQMHSMPFIGKPTEAMMSTEPSTAATLAPHLCTREEAPACRAFGMQWRLLAGSAQTAGTYNLFEVTMPAGATLGPWIHAQDQAFYVLDGAAQVLLDDRSSDVAAGTFSFVPAGTAQAVRAGTEGAQLLLFHLPGGLDQAVGPFGNPGSEAAADDDRLRDGLAAMGTRWIAPPIG